MKFFDKRICLSLSIIIAFAMIATIPNFYLSYYDEADYLLSAHDLICGYWHISGVHSLRIGTIIFYAIPMLFSCPIKLLVGITMIEFAALIVLVYTIGAVIMENKLVGIMTSIVVATSKPFLEITGTITSDIILTLLTTGIVFICMYFLTNKERLELSPRRWGIAFAIISTLAIIAKESALFFLPLGVVFFIKNRKDVKFKTFQTAAFSVFAIVLIAGILFIWWVTGDPIAWIFVFIDNIGTGVTKTGSTTIEIIIHSTFGVFEMFSRDFSSLIIFFLGCLSLFLPPKTKIQAFMKAYLIGVLGSWFLWVVIQSYLSGKLLELQIRLWEPVFIPIVLNTMDLIFQFVQNGIQKISLFFKFSIHTSFMSKSMCVFIAMLFGFRAIDETYKYLSINQTSYKFKEYKVEESLFKLLSMKKYDKIQIIGGSGFVRNLKVFNNFKDDKRLIEYQKVLNPEPNAIFVLNKADTLNQSFWKDKPDSPNYTPDYVRNPEAYGNLIFRDTLTGITCYQFYSIPHYPEE